MPRLLTQTWQASPALALADRRLISPVGVYSLRVAVPGWSGNIIRVRRANDNAEVNIGSSAGVVDTAAILTHCGANDCFISVWYDQSGNARDLAQTTTGRQFRIATASTIDTIGGNPCAHVSWVTGAGMYGPVITPTYAGLCFGAAAVFSQPNSGSFARILSFSTDTTADNAGASQGLVICRNSTTQAMEITRTGGGTISLALPAYDSLTAFGVRGSGTICSVRQGASNLATGNMNTAWGCNRMLLGCTSGSGLAGAAQGANICEAVAWWHDPTPLGLSLLLAEQRSVFGAS